MSIENMQERINQLRAVEAELLRPISPVPDDPTVEFSFGYVRAALIEKRNASGNSAIPFRSQNSSNINVNESEDEINFNENQRNLNELVNEIENRGRQLHRNENRSENPNVIHRYRYERRPISPSDLPGVRAIPKEYNRMFRGLLTPGEFFAKSHTRYLGPFATMPTVVTLPAGDNYIILQRMGRLPESGKSIFRQVGSLIT